MRSWREQLHALTAMANLRAFTCSSAIEIERLLRQIFNFNIHTILVAAGVGCAL